MGSVSKLQKLCNEDRISDLPDSIIIHILSFLPTKSAVSTSKLSKRWRTLYVSLPNLDFTESYYDKKRGGYIQKMGFINFVDRFFRLKPHNFNLESFRLDYCRDVSVNCVDEWILCAVRHNVKKLRLDVWGRAYRLVPEVYMCTSIEVLRLDSNIIVDVPENVSFPSLKALVLEKVKLLSCESVANLLLNCPVLEELAIDNCRWLTGGSLSVCGLSLKKLILHSCCDTKRVEFRLDTPALEILQIREVTCNDNLITKNLQALTTASINIAPNMDMHIRDRVYGESVFSFLSKISLVKSLTLYEDVLRALSDAAHCRFSTFYNLTRLELAWSSWNLLLNILARTPKLQHLVLQNNDADTSSSEVHYFTSSLADLPEPVPQCLSSHLKTIELGYFEGTEAEWSLVEYFLSHGKTLEKMSISCISEKITMEKMLNLRRASTICKVDICNVYKYDK